MKDNSTIEDNKGKNAINEELDVIKIIPKNICNALPNIKIMKISEKNYANVITYGRDYTEVCPHCGRKFEDHDTILY